MNPVSSDPCGGGGASAGADSGVHATSHHSEDLYAQLSQKETDLILAAELGKALLEKNEELRRRNQDMEEQFQDKIEVGCENSFTKNYRKMRCDVCPHD